MKRFAALISIFFLSSVAEAGFMIEPYLNYTTSNFGTVVAGVPVGYKEKGTTGIGGRIGYKLLLPIWIAADISQSSGKMTADVGGSTSDYSRSATYATVGFDFPILFRAWAGIALSHSVSLDDGAGGKNEFKTGTGNKMGVGLGLIPFLSVNIEYFQFKPSGPATFSGLDENGLMIGVSAPFNL